MCDAYDRTSAHIPPHPRDTPRHAHTRHRDHAHPTRRHNNPTCARYDLCPSHTQVRSSDRVPHDLNPGVRLPPGRGTPD